MSFETHIAKTTSEKNTIVWLHARERIIAAWDSSSAPTYTLTADRFVSAVYEDGTALTSASLPLSVGEFNYDPDTNLLSIRTSADDDPADVFIAVEYRFFYSNKPQNQPYDLSTGSDVYYDGRLSTISKFGLEIDNDDLTGVALAGKGSLSFNNTDGHFKAIYDKLFWEDGEVIVYSKSPDDKQIIYRGYIYEKAYSSTRVTFKVKDFIDKLRDEVPLSVFESTDGDIPESLVGTPKRRVYGRVAGLKTVSLDQTLDGYTLTGTISGTTNTISGSGTSFLDETSPGDIIVYQDTNGEDVEYSIETIASDISLTVVEDIETAFSGKSATIKPDIPWRKRNRERFISGHQLASPATTVTHALQLNRITVASTSGLAADDFIFVGSEKSKIRRISGLVLVLNTNLNSLPVVTTAVTKSPIQDAYIKNRKLVLTRDYTITNGASLSKITLEDDAELSIAPSKKFSESCTFTQSSREVTGTNFENTFQPRDWIRPVGTSAYYEILQIDDDTTLQLRTAYATADKTDTVNYKRPDYVDDSAVVHVNCLGKEDADGNWITTCPGVVKDLFIEAGLTTQINTASFASAVINAPYLPSLTIPTSFGGEKPTVKDITILLNKSVFGSAYYNSDYEITYSVLTPQKPTTATIVRDRDIIGWSVESSGTNITKTITGSYRFSDYNQQTEASGSLTYSKENDFISKISTIAREELMDLYLYRTGDAQIMVDRTSLLREFANLVIKVDAKINFANKSINDVLQFEFDRLFDRFGTSSDTNQIGIITKISQDGSSSTISVTSLSGLYNKVCIIAPSGTADYSSSTADERALHGYITGSNELVDDNESTYRMNLIG